jgi:nicotinamide-nucleotide amidase
MTAYTIDQKCTHLGVDRPNALVTNCVSQQTADEMAMGACKLFGADISIATTGYAEPYLAEQIDVPFAYISIYDASLDVFLTQDKYI